MAFFARPDLSNEQFKQLTGSTLTLSGTTQIPSIGKLEFQDKDTGSYIPVEISGASPQDVLTYEDGKLILKQPSSGTSTGIYDCATPSAICVGGMPAGTTLSGRTIANILQEILVPTLYPTLSSPYSVFCITPSTSPLEVGCSINVTGSITFNQGSISPAYCGGPAVRSGAPVAYSFSYWNGSPYVTGTSSSCNFGTRVITVGSNTAYGCVHYEAGLQPLDSCGNNYCSELPAGSTNSTCPNAVITRIIVGIYPYFYGISDTTPVAGSGLLATAVCKEIKSSCGSIAVDFNAMDKYLWLAIPKGTNKVKWAGSNSPTNTESIPGALFPVKSTVPVDSPSNCWCGVEYDFYISNYKTTTYEGTAPYTITFTNS